jgi:hypothetical protein
METKKYSTYAEIDRDLEILKIEKEIEYHKLVLSFQKTKESFTPQGIVNNFLSSYKSILSNSYLDIIKMGLPYLIQWILKRKRDA